MTRSSLAHPRLWRGRSRTERALVGTALALLAAGAATLSMSPAGADTSGTPDTVTKAAVAPAIPSIDAPGTLTGLVEGTPVNVHVDGVPGSFFGVNQARVCRSGLNVTTSSQLSPERFGDCIDVPFVAGTDDEYMQVSAAPNNTAVDFTFRVGSGTEAAADHPGPGAPITCDAANPCALWLWESVNTTIAPTGSIFKHFELQYGAGGGTTTTAPTSTSTTAPTSTTTLTTAPTTTTSTAPSSTTTTLPDTTTTSTLPPDLAVSPASIGAGGTVTVTSTGWSPATAVDIVLHSDPVTLDTVTTDASGALTSQVVIPANAEIGDHQLELVGVGANSAARSLTTALTITAPAAAPSETPARTEATGAPLARTGTGSLALAWSGTAMTAAGVLITMASKRRRIEALR